MDLGVWAAGGLVRSPAHYHALIVDDDRPDHRIRARPPTAALRQRNCARHLEFVG
jgi:hypothetical protein